MNVTDSNGNPYDWTDVQRHLRWAEAEIDFALGTQELEAGAVHSALASAHAHTAEAIAMVLNVRDFQRALLTKDHP